MFEFKDANVNKLLQICFERMQEDEEYQWRGNEDLKILVEQVKKVEKYVENNFAGELYLTDNLWCICQETLDLILNLYDLKLEENDKVTEHTKVLFNNTKEKELHSNNMNDDNGIDGGLDGSIL